MASKYNRILEEEVDVARFTKSWSDLQVIEKKLKNKATLSSHMKTLSNVEQEIHRSLCEGSVPNQKLVDKLRDVYISTPKYRDIQQQTALLLATCEWRLGNVDRALTLLKESVTPPPTTSSTEGTPPHLLQYCKLQAQGHAVLGLCYEQTGKRDEAVRSYQGTMQWLGQLSHLIEQQTRGLSAVPGADIFLPEINMSIAQGCILLLALRGDRAAIAFCRTGVLLHDCPLFQVLREIASLCLANTLVFHSSGNQYSPPTAEPRPPTFQKIPAPASADEETMLVLSLLLSRPLAPEAGLLEIQHQFASYASLSDLLLVEYSGCQLRKAAVCMTEANLPFTAVSHAPWVDYFLASLTLGKNPAKLSMVTKEVVKEVKDSPATLLFAAKTALTVAQQPLQAMQWCLEWIERPTDPAYLPVAHMTVASAALQLHRQFATSTSSSPTPAERGEDYYIKMAADHIAIAVSLDSRNVEMIFKQAVVLGERRKLRDSRSLARSALQIDPTHPGVTHLLAIMLTGEKKLKEALNLVEFALSHWKRNFGLRMSQIVLVNMLKGSQAALEVCRQILHTSDHHSSPLPHDTSTTTATAITPGGGVGGGGVVPHIVVGSSTSSGSQLEGSDFIGSSCSAGSSAGQPARLWCKTAEIFLACEKYGDAEDSLREAQQIDPNTTEVLLLTGQLHEAQGRIQDAIVQYKLAIVLNPRHPQPHIAMGQILLNQGEILESKRHLKQAMEVEPKNQVAWCLMGQIYTALKNHQKATECFSTSLTLEQSSPCLPLSNISDFM